MFKTYKLTHALITPVPHQPNASALKVRNRNPCAFADVAMHGDGKGSDILSEYIECSCSGIMACSTCHVVIDKDFYKRVGEPDEDELDMIDLAYEPTPTSRLGCQVGVTRLEKETLKGGLRC